VSSLTRRCHRVDRHCPSVPATGTICNVSSQLGSG